MGEQQRSLNDQAHWLSAFTAITHLTIGLPELLNIGPRFLPPSWQVIYRFSPDGLDWVYPTLWVATGVVAAIGAKRPYALRVGFRMSAGLFLIWGCAGIPAYLMGVGGNIQGVVANWFIAGCAWVLSHYVSIGMRGDEINKQVERLAQQVHRAESGPTQHGPDAR